MPPADWTSALPDRPRRGLQGFARLANIGCAHPSNSISTVDLRASSRRALLALNKSVIWGRSARRPCSRAVKSSPGDASANSVSSPRTLRQKLGERDAQKCHGLFGRPNPLLETPEQARPPVVTSGRQDEYPVGNAFPERVAKAFVACHACRRANRLSKRQLKRVSGSE